MINDSNSGLGREDELAKKRFLAIQSMRFMGAGLVILGLLIVNGVVDLPGIVGFVLVVIGIMDALLMPVFLKKRWKSPLE